MPRNPIPTSNMQNRLWIARNRAGYSQKWVRHLLGKRSLASISEYERGHKLPPLPVALKLELIYQTTLAELFPNLHASVTQEIVKAKKGLLSVELRDAEVQEMRRAKAQLNPALIAQTGNNSFFSRRTFSNTAASGWTPMWVSII